MYRSKQADKSLNNVDLMTWYQDFFEIVTMPKCQNIFGLITGMK